LISLRSKGIDWIYLLGVWELGDIGLQFDRKNGCDPYYSTLPDCTVDDIIGSVFAVTNYTTNAQIGTDNDLIAFRTKLHSMGMKLMLDFVPNHSALDSYLITKKNALSLYIQAPPGTKNTDKYYTNGVAYGCAAYCAPWQDVAQFNYFNPETREQMSTYLSLIASLGDGVRCDMAHVVLNEQFYSQWKTEIDAYGFSYPSEEFWPSAIAAAKKVNPSLVVISEVYGESNMKYLQSLGFDFTYDKELFDRLSEGNLDNIRGYITGNTLEFMQKNTHFLENHDDNRGIPHFGTYQRADAATAVLFTVPGMKFSFMGQWVGKTYKLDVHLRRSYTEAENTVVSKFYDTLIPIVGNAPFTNGTFTSLSATSDDSAWSLLTWKWVESSRKRLVVVNYSEQYGSGAIKLTDCTGSGNVPVKDLISGTTYERDAGSIRTSGLFVSLAPWQVQIFSYP
jgi:glycosidase